MDNCRFTTTIALMQEFCHSHDYQVVDDDESDTRWRDTDDHFETNNWSPDWNAEKKTRCTKPKMIENFYMRYFNFNASVMRMFNIYASWSPNNRNDVFLQSIAFGREVGKMTRILYDFHLTDEAKEIVTREFFSDL